MIDQNKSYLPAIISRQRYNSYFLGQMVRHTLAIHMYLNMVTYPFALATSLREETQPDLIDQLPVDRTNNPWEGEDY